MLKEENYNRSYTKRRCPSSFLHPSPSRPSVLRSSRGHIHRLPKKIRLQTLAAATAQDTAVSKSKPP
ncbi:hypothetical protein YC2023_113184 [Brassica napus]